MKTEFYFIRNLTQISYILFDITIKGSATFTLATVDLHWNSSEHVIASSEKATGKRPVALNNFV